MKRSEFGSHHAMFSVFLGIVLLLFVFAHLFVFIRSDMVMTSSRQHTTVDVVHRGRQAVQQPDRVTDESTDIAP